MRGRENLKKGWESGKRGQQRRLGENMKMRKERGKKMEWMDRGGRSMEGWKE